MIDEVLRKLNQKEAFRYRWGMPGSGFGFIGDEGKSAIIASLPPEACQLQPAAAAWRFLFVLRGLVTVLANEQSIQASRHEGVEVAPNAELTLVNESDADIAWLLVTAAGDAA
jgi:glyoxylate utilization-related uncharacterized protein